MYINMDNLILYIFIAILLIVNAKWIFFILLYPFMAINGHNYSKSFIGKLLASPYLICERIFSGGVIRYFIISVGYIPSLYIRKWLYMGLGARISPKVVIHYKTEIRCPQQLILGQGTIIGDNAILDARCGLTIGRNVNLSSNVSIYTLQHDHRDPYFRCNENMKKMSVEIDDRVWLGSNVIVLPGVHIGEGAVCCAGCVITKNVEPFTVVAGIPAKKVGERPKVLKYEFKGKSCAFY